MNAAVVNKYFIFTGTNGLASNEQRASRATYKRLNHSEHSKVFAPGMVWNGEV
jgi:hypothetical protein